MDIINFKKLNLQGCLETFKSISLKRLTKILHQKDTLLHGKLKI